jgi:hypothetical protein
MTKDDLVRVRHDLTGHAPRVPFAHALTIHLIDASEKWFADEIVSGEAQEGKQRRVRFDDQTIANHSEREDAGHHLRKVTSFAR